jgi:hypothetical protein
VDFLRRLQRSLDSTQDRSLERRGPSFHGKNNLHLRFSGSGSPRTLRSERIEVVLPSIHGIIESTHVIASCLSESPAPPLILQNHGTSKHNSLHNPDFHAQYCDLSSTHLSRSSIVLNWVSSRLYAISPSRLLTDFRQPASVKRGLRQSCKGSSSLTLPLPAVWHRLALEK